MDPCCVFWFILIVRPTRSLTPMVWIKICSETVHQYFEVGERYLEWQCVWHECAKNGKPHQFTMNLVTSWSDKMERSSSFNAILTALVNKSTLAMAPFQHFLNSKSASCNVQLSSRSSLWCNNESECTWAIPPISEEEPTVAGAPVAAHRVVADLIADPLLAALVHIWKCLVGLL